MSSDFFVGVFTGGGGWRVPETETLLGGGVVTPVCALVVAEGGGGALTTAGVVVEGGGAAACTTCLGFGWSVFGEDRPNITPTITAAPTTPTIPMLAAMRGHRDFAGAGVGPPSTSDAVDCASPSRGIDSEGDEASDTWGNAGSAGVDVAGIADAPTRCSQSPHGSRRAPRASAR